MKQSEIDRQLRAIAKAEAKARGWKSVGGMPYWTVGPLFFVLVQSAGAKEGSFFGALRFKWLELDNALWHVLGMSSNENEPFSLHANGAFALMGQEILSISERSIEWVPGALEQRVRDSMQRSHERAAEVASQIETIDSYMTFIQREHIAFMEHHPRAVVNVWKEALLVALLMGDPTGAAQIARARINAHDSGGYSSGGKSFYEHALAHCEKG